MKRFHVHLEGEITVLDSDIEEEDFINAGFEDHYNLTDDELNEVVKMTADRLVRHSGLQVNDMEVMKID
jgi:hypothetical protein